MKGIIVYSSNTGNTKKAAEKIYETIKDSGNWTIENVKDSPDVSSYDIILLGGWAESGTIDKSSREFLVNVPKEGQKVGLFVTMGSRTLTEHGKFCENNLKELLVGYDSLGTKLLQGKVSDALMQRLESLPESVIPESVKVAMRDGYENYREITDQEYQKIAEYFLNQL